MIHSLYVDDESYLLELVRKYLGPCGISVTTENSASYALENLDLSQYAAIMSDYKMPGMDGISFLKEVRR